MTIWTPCGAYQFGNFERSWLKILMYFHKYPVYVSGWKGEIETEHFAQKCKQCALARTVKSWAHQGQIQVGLRL